MGNIWQINFSCLSLSHFVNAKLKSSRQALSSRTKLLWANSRARSDFQPKFSSLKLHTKPLRMGGCNVTQPGCILSIYSGPNLLGKVWNWSTHWPDTFTQRKEEWGRQRQKYFRCTRSAYPFAYYISGTGSCSRQFPQPNCWSEVRRRTVLLMWWGQRWRTLCLVQGKTDPLGLRLLRIWVRPQERLCGT